MNNTTQEEKTQKVPELLYHYTDLESLGKILEYQTIRFNRYDRFDDPEEIETADFGDFGRFMFGSCWTDEERESIPMWKMYSDNLKGVRIRLPKYPFQRYVKQESSETFINGKSESKEYSTNYSCFIPPHEDKTYTISPIDNVTGFLYEMIYTEEEDLLRPAILVSEISNTILPDGRIANSHRRSILTNKVGRYKRLVWKFQNEWRYNLLATPWGLSNPSLRTPEGHQDLLMMLKNGNHSTSYIDLKIDPVLFNEMEITLGPKSTKYDMIIAKWLVAKYNPSAKIRRSIIRLR